MPICRVGGVRSWSAPFLRSPWRRSSQAAWAVPSGPLEELQAERLDLGEQAVKYCLSPFEEWLEGSGRTSEEVSQESRDWLGSDHESRSSRALQNPLSFQRERRDRHDRLKTWVVRPRHRRSVEFDGIQGA
jgi:hypothetical protein